MRLVTPWRLILGAVAMLAFLLYARHLTGGAIADDHGIIEGHAIGGGRYWLDCFTKPFLDFYFRPLVAFSFYLNGLGTGRAPFALHAVNTLMHVLTSVLVCVLAFLITGKKVAGLAAGGLYAIHPALIGAVAWIGGRTDAQSTMFLVASLTALAMWHRGSRIGWLLCAGVLFLASLLSKEQAIAAAPAMMASGYFLSRKRATLRHHMATGLAIGVPSCVFVYWWLSCAPSFFGKYSNGLADRAQDAMRAISDYALLLFAPNPWAFHSYSTLDYESPLWVLFGGAVTLGTLGWLWWSYRTDKVVFWLSSVSVLALVPVANFFTIPSLPLASYRAALAIPTFAILLAVLATHESRRWRLGVAGPIAVLVAASMWMQWKAPNWYRDDKSYFHAVATYDPGPVMWINYAYARESTDGRSADETARMLDRLFEGRRWEAFEKIPEIVRSDSSIYGRIRMCIGNRLKPSEMLSDILHHHGKFLAQEGDFKNATRVLNCSIALQSDNTDAWVVLGAVHQCMNDPRGAERCYRQAWKTDVTNSRAAARLGDVYYARHDYARAILCYYVPLANESVWGSDYSRCANAMIALGKLDNARAVLNQGSKAIWLSGEMKATRANLQKAMDKREANGVRSSTASRSLG